jgi:uncharacterized protein
MPNQGPSDQIPGERIRIPVNTENSTPSQPGESASAADAGISARADNLAAIDELLGSKTARDELSIDELVGSYEERYSGFRSRESDKIKRDAAGSPRPVARPRSYVVGGPSAVGEEERMWAAIAHGSAILTLLVGMLTGGLATLFTLFIPLGIYFAFRQRSPYVAYAALQAFAIQVLGTVGWLVLVVAGSLIGVILMILLFITVIGIPVALLVGVVLAVLILTSLVIPFGMAVYGGIAAWQTYQGKQYRYPWIADWIDRQMHGGFLANL